MIKARPIWAITVAAGTLAMASPASAAPPSDPVPPTYQEGDPLPGGDPPPIPAPKDDTPPPPYQEGDPLPGGDPPPIAAPQDESTPPASQEGDPLSGGDPAAGGDSAAPIKMVAAAYVGDTTKQFKRVASRHGTRHPRHRRLRHHKAH